MCCCLTFGTKSGHIEPSFHFRGPNGWIWYYFGPHFAHKKTQSEPTCFPRCGNASSSFSSLVPPAKHQVHPVQQVEEGVRGEDCGQYWLQLNMKANHIKLSAEKNKLVVVSGLAVQVIEQFQVSFWNAAPPFILILSSFSHRTMLAPPLICLHFSACLPLKFTPMLSLSQVLLQPAPGENRVMKERWKLFIVKSISGPPPLLINQHLLLFLNAK